MKKLQLTILTASIILATSLVTASPVKTSPETFNLELVSGSSTTQNISVTWTGNQIKYIQIKTSLEAEDTDTTGINSSVNPAEMVLNPGETRNTTLNLTTHPALQPDNFTVTVNATTNRRVFRDQGGGGGSGTSEREVETIVSSSVSSVENRTQDLEHQLEKLNQTIGELNKTQEKRILKELRERDNKVIELRNRVKNLTQQINETDSKKDTGTGKDRGILQSALHKLFTWFTTWFGR